jgi:RHS repeat-associated protein
MYLIGKAIDFLAFRSRPDPKTNKGELRMRAWVKFPGLALLRNLKKKGSRVAATTLFILTVLGATQPVTAQTAADAHGFWQGTLTEQPAAGPFPGGLYDISVMLYQNSTGGVVGTGLTSTGQYWIQYVYSGSVSGTTLTLTSSIVNFNLPFGYYPCTGTTTYAVDNTTSQMSTSGGSCGGHAIDPYVLFGGGSSKTNGSPNHVSPGTGTGEPVDVGSGNVFDAFTDYETAGPNKLSFIRYYNSKPTSPLWSATGPRMMAFNNWTTNFDRGFIISADGNTMYLTRPDARGLTFKNVGGIWTPDTDVDMVMVHSGSTWTLTDHNDTVETYTQFVTGGQTGGRLSSIKTRNGYTQTLTRNGGNQLTSVTDSYGRTLTFTYYSGLLPFIQTVTTPDSLVLTFTYNSFGLIDTVSYNTSPVTSKTYHYGASGFANLLTSITDENGNAYASWTYDGYGRALTSQLAGGADLTTVVYDDSTGKRTVTNGLGQPLVYTLVNFNNTSKITRIDRTGTSTVSAGFETFTYDANGYLATARNWNGYTTAYTNNAHGDPTTIVEASGNPLARTTTIAYDSTWVHLPASAATPGLTTSFTYDTGGNLLTKTLTDTTTQSVPYSTNGQTRTWNYTWSNFLPHTAQTPNGNTTTFTYDSTGALVNTQNPLSQSTQITSHTGGGLPLTSIDPNGVTTTLTYSPRNWLLTATVATASGNRTTTNAYDAVGSLLSVTQPDGSVLTNTYDTAHRLTKVTDSFGNSQNLTLDALGDVTASNIKNPSNVVTKTDAATFDSLGRKKKDTNGAGFNTLYSYDGNSNLTTYNPPYQGNTYYRDALDRTYQESVSPYGSILTTWDAHDRPLTVTARNGAVTSYVYDGFGDKIQETSPDRGTTVYYYDGDGNLTSKTDALSVVTNYTYDALDRMLTTSYPASASENVTYTYDQTGTGFAFGIGRLTTVTDMAGTLTRSYDERGNLITDKRTNGGTVLTTTYGYDAASRVASITYPSGLVVTYVRDAMGRITSVSGQPSGAPSATTLASSVTYAPFGPWLGLTYGNGIVETVTRNTVYQLLTLKDIGTATAQNLTYTIHPQIGLAYAYTDGLSSTNNYTFPYDALYRGFQLYASGLTLAYNYDANGNRTSVPQQSLTYTYAANSNRLATIVQSGTTTTVTTDARGSITAFSPGYGTAGVTTLNYNNGGRLTSVASASGTLGSYVYDSSGRRFSKTVGSATTLFTHSPGSVLLEESTGGAPLDYIYLNDRPIATLSGSTFTYLHGSQLGAPQVMTNAGQTVLGRLSTLPFGETRSTSGSFTVNLRMPGQYYDAETGFSHNVNRDYFPALGRYLQADPVGIFQTRNEGGMNPYLYVNARPMDLMDPLGLTSAGTSGPDIWNAFLNGYGGIPGFGPVLYQNLNILLNIYSFGLRGAVATGATLAEELITIDEAPSAPEVPNTLARVIPGEGPFETLGLPNAKEVFVTDPAAIEGLTPAQIQERLTIEPSDTYTIIEFPTPTDGVATPVYRDNPGFIQGGRTGGGAPEWVVPNGPLPPGSTSRTVREPK